MILLTPHADSPLSNETRKSKPNPIIALDGTEQLVKYDVEISKYSVKKVNSLSKVSIISDGLLTAFYKNTGHVAVHHVEKGTNKKLKESSLCWLTSQPDIIQVNFPYFVMVYFKLNSPSTIKIFKFGGFSKEIKLCEEVLHVFTQKSGIFILTQKNLHKVSNFNSPKIDITIPLEKSLQDLKISELSSIRDDVALIVYHNKKEFILLDTNTGKWLSGNISLGNQVLTIDMNEMYVVSICLGDIFYYNISTKTLKTILTDDVKPSCLLMCEEGKILVGFIDGTVSEFDLNSEGSKTVLVTGLGSSGDASKYLKLNNCVFKICLLSESKFVVFKQKSACVYEISEGIVNVISVLEWKGKGSNFSLFKNDSKQENLNKSFDSVIELMPESEPDRKMRSSNPEKKSVSDTSGKSLTSKNSFNLENDTVVNFRVTNYDGSEQLWVWKPLMKSNSKEKLLLFIKTKRKSKQFKEECDTPSFTLNKVRGFYKQEKLIKDSNSNSIINTEPEEMPYNKEIKHLHLRRLRGSTLTVCKLNTENNLEECQLEDVFTNDTLYYYLELYLKEKHAEELLYFVVDVEDYRTCFYEDHTILERCSKALINLWIGHEITFTENYTHLSEQKPSLNMFDEIQMEAIEMIKSRWNEFRVWLTNTTKPNRQILKKSKKFKKVLSLHSIENRFSRILEDELLYKNFHQYLQTKNTTQLLYFHETYKYFKQYVRALSTEDTLQDTEKIVTMFFLGDLRTKIQVEDKHLVVNLLTSLLNKDLNCLNILDQLSVYTTQYLKTFYWNFCYELKSKHPNANIMIKYFNKHNQSIEFFKKPHIKYQIAICDKISALQNRTEKSNMINYFKDLKQTAKFVNEHISSLKYLKDPDTRRFKLMFEQKIFSVGMFYGIKERIQQYLLMLFVDVEYNNVDL